MSAPRPIRDHALSALRHTDLATVRSIDAIVRQLRDDGTIAATMQKYGIAFLPPDAAAK